MKKIENNEITSTSTLIDAALTLTQSRRDLGMDMNLFMFSFMNEFLFFCRGPSLQRIPIREEEEAEDHPHSGSARDLHLLRRRHRGGVRLPQCNGHSQYV